MNQIKCPNCGEVFTVDESGYNEIVRQVRDETFEKEIERSIKAAEEQKSSEIRALTAEKDSLINEITTRKDSEINALKAEKESELRTLRAELDKLRSESIAAKDREIAELRAAIEAGEQARELAVIKATGEKENELAEKKLEVEKLKSEIEMNRQASEISEKNIIEKYEAQIRDKDEVIRQYKDFKARQSTKMIGESLERHCETEFNKIRAAAFPNAYFEKDNDASSGSKGDYIFRELDADKTEIVSIMFEMKNEADTTASKHRNEDFFKELDKDRREKKCEYAVLVSMLEMDNDLYNEGIVDVSHRYEKMYVIRPQFFIPIITLLRNTSMKSLSIRKELAVVKEQNIDITHFEDEMKAFQEAFDKNYSTSRKYYEKTIDEIDKSIRSLERIKEALTTSINQLRLANSKAQDLSIKKLTKNNPTMRARFEEIRAEKERAAEDAEDIGITMD
ncbi:MAG: DUF2130 domain-containing protein [Clostridia bacterium]|nr:DUF2130 domain-containing protein [Clostridia bacterium]